MTGKVFIVTGASRGIGLATAQFLLKKPQTCNLVVVARSREALDKLKNAYNDQVQVLVGDLGDLTLGEKAAKLATSTWNRLDGVVINHGMVDPVARIADVNVEEWRSTFDVNVFSAVALVKASLPFLRESKGRIIFTSSGAAVKGTSTWGCYGASKAVLNHLALTLAKEEPQVTTVSVRPGVVATKMQDELRDTHFKTMDPEDTKRFIEMREQGEMLKPEQPGHVIARLVLDAPLSLSGLFVSWNDQKLADFQD